MKELFIHIGQLKTGTSALQLFLSENRDKLLETGIYYPRLNGEYKIEEKTSCFSGNGQILEKLDRPLTELRTDEKKTLLSIKYWFEQWDRILISNEGFWGCDSLLYKNLIEYLCEGVQLRIIAYIRRQDEYAESVWNQAVKSGLSKQPCTEFCEAGNFDWYEVLRKISDVVGKENMIVRVYDTKHFHGMTNSIYADFLSIFGIRDLSGFEIPKYQTNPPLGKNMVEIKRILNTLPEFHIIEEQVRNTIRKYIVFGKSTEAITKAPAFLTYEERKKLLDKYETSNQKIGREYLNIDGNPFLPLGGGGETQGTESVYEDIVRLFGSLLIDQEKELEKLRQRVECFDLKEVTPGSSVIIYGADRRGRRLYGKIKDQGKFRMCGIVDKRFEKLRQTYGFVENPEIVFRMEIDYILIGVFDEKSALAIQEYLKARGISTEKIIRV